MTARNLGVHNARVARARELLAAKGRKEQQRFLLEGPTLLAEALRSGIALDEVYATEAARERYSIVSELESLQVPLFLVDERTAAKLSDLKTAPGIIAAAQARYEPLAKLFSNPGVILLLADLNDPGNAGTLIRSADAFGVDRIIFGRAGVEPHHPKVVRAAMGSLFRSKISVAGPDEVSAAVQSARWVLAGLSAQGEPIGSLSPGPRVVLAVGQERQGLGSWSAACGRSVAIGMPGRAESLNAAVAGSIALYELTRAPA